MLNAAELETVFMECLFEKEEVTEGEIPVNAVFAQGIQRDFYFHGGRLEENKEKIASFIDDLSEDFKEGQSFLNMCATRNGDLWGEHRNCEQLMALGIASELLDCFIPKALWNTLPGGMPYLKIVEGAETE